MMSRLFIKAALGVGLALLTSAAASAADKVRFGTNWLAQGAHGGYYQALADGTYARYGLDVEIIPGGPQVNSRPLLPAGRLDFLMAGNMLLPFDNVRGGIPTKAVAAFFQKDPQALMAHKGQYKDFADLANAPQVLIAKDAQFSFWLWLVARHGFRDEQVRPYGFNLSAFLQDKKVVQQAYATSEPGYAMAEGGDPEVYLLADHGWSSYSSVIEARTEMIESNPDLIQRFIDASAIGWTTFLYGDNSAAVQAIMAANPDLSVEKLNFEIEQIKTLGLADANESLTLGMGAMTEERVKSFYDLAVEAGIFKAEDVDLSKVADFRFVNKGVGLDLRKELTGQ